MIILSKPLPRADRNTNQPLNIITLAVSELSFASRVCNHCPLREYGNDAYRE